MNIQNLQRGLLNWFWLDPNQIKKYNSIENISMKLFEQYFHDQNPQKAKYEIFHPLLKYGVIEFYGDKSYGLSPSCALYSNSNILLINIPLEIFHSNVFIFTYENPSLGIIVIKNSAKAILELRNLSLPVSNFILSNSLKKLSTFQSIINGWVDDTVLNSKDFDLFNENFNWVKNEARYKSNLYKKSPESYAQRTIKLSNGKWKIVPSRDSNIDAFNLAVVWNQLQNRWPLEIKYIEKENKIIINNQFFPLILERLLFINTLLQFDNRINVFKREYFINKSDFNILNKQFENKIVII